jgi:hypothetical protein
LKSCQLAFLLAIVTILLELIPLPGDIVRLLNVLFLPLGYVTEYLFGWLGEPSKAFLWVSVLLSVGYLSCLWLLIILGFRRSSTGLKIALALCALATWGVSTELNAYRERIAKARDEWVDWTSRGLNPNSPGFKPETVVLAGTFEFNLTGSSSDPPGTPRPYAGTARFEIRMRGADYYYAERWMGHLWVYGSWDQLLLSLPDYSGAWNRSYSGSGHHGRGTSGEGSYEGLLLARRLWRGEDFIGAEASDEVSIKGATERFSDLLQYGPFKIPERIEFMDKDQGQDEVYHIRKVEFLKEPDTNWFRLIQQKYFEHNDSLRSTNLNEAGWSGEKNP